MSNKGIYALVSVAFIGLATQCVLEATGSQWWAFAAFFTLMFFHLWAVCFFPEDK